MLLNLMITIVQFLKASSFLVPSQVLSLPSSFLVPSQVLSLHVWLWATVWDRTDFQTFSTLQKAVLDSATLCGEEKKHLT